MDTLFAQKSVSFSLFRPFREELPGVARFLHAKTLFYIYNTIGFEVLDFEDSWGGLDMAVSWDLLITRHDHFNRIAFPLMVAPISNAPPPGSSATKLLRFPELCIPHIWGRDGSQEVVFLLSRIEKARFLDTFDYTCSRVIHIGMEPEIHSGLE